MQTHKHILNGKRQPPILTIHFDWSVGLAEGVLDHTFVGAKVTDVDLLDCELHHHLVVAGFVRRRFKAFAWVEMRRGEQTQPQWVAVYWLGGYWLLHWMLLWVCVCLVWDDVCSFAWHSLHSNISARFHWGDITRYDRTRQASVVDGLVEVVRRFQMLLLCLHCGITL